MMRVPPPVLAVSIAVATLAATPLGRLWPQSLHASCVALLLAMAGTFIDLCAKRLLIRSRTTVNPMTPSSTAVIVHAGPYRWSRNPMYLGRLMQLLALALYTASPPGLACVAAFAVYLDRVQIPVEERALSVRFPVEFDRYQSRVRRWI